MLLLEGAEAVGWEVTVKPYRFDVLTISDGIVHIVEVKTSVEDLKAGLRRSQLDAYSLSSVRPNYISLAFPEELTSQVAQLEIPSQVGLILLKKSKGRDETYSSQLLRPPEYWQSTTADSVKLGMVAIARSLAHKLLIDGDSKVPANGIVKMIGKHKAD